MLSGYSLVHGPGSDIRSSVYGTLKLKSRHHLARGTGERLNTSQMQILIQLLSMPSCIVQRTARYQLYFDALSCSPRPYFLGLSAGYYVTKYTAFPYSEYFTAIIPEICRHLVD